MTMDGRKTLPLKKGGGPVLVSRSQKEEDLTGEKPQPLPQSGGEKGGGEKKSPFVNIEERLSFKNLIMEGEDRLCRRKRSILLSFERKGKKRE